MKKPLLFCAPAALWTVLTLLAAPGLARAQAPAPSAAWNFDEGSGTAAADSSGHNLAATLRGGAGWATGLLGAHAVALPGMSGSFIDIPQPVVDTSRSFTVAAWVKVNQVTGFQTFVSIDGGQVSGFFLQLRADGDLAFTVLPSDMPGDPAALVEANADTSEDTWYHLAGVYDAGAKTVSFYVDGALQKTVPFTQPWRAGGHTVIGRGRYSGNPVDFVAGQIDDVRFYQSALSAADVKTLAGPGLTVKAQIEAAKPAPAPATLQIDAARPTMRLSPTLYGLMIEDISHSIDGGLYAELIQNRAFKDDPSSPVHWTLAPGDGAGTIALDTGHPVPGTTLTNSLRLDVTSAGGARGVGAANDGYWGIPVKPNTAYRASLYAMAGAGYTGPLTVDIESADGASVYAQATIPAVTTTWKKYGVVLTTSKAAPTGTANRCVVAAHGVGTVWLTQVSLFPPTFHDRPNGTRVDLMQTLDAMHPTFLRMPGGNYLEGNTVGERFDWKKTIGDIAQRPGHQDPWGYRSDDGFGLLEYLEWCEDLKMQPVLAVFAGYALRGEHVNPGPDLAPYVRDALDEIEYVTGGPDTQWGAERVRDGHPAPYPLTYVEIGNEDWFDKSGSYDGRYAQFYDAIKAKYPKLQLIATAGVKSRTPDVIDEHYYRSPASFETDAHKYDTYSRTGPKVFVGEWASQDGRPTPNLNSALGDAAWMTGMERNSDVVTIESYAPLLVNVNPGASQWGTNLIGFDALNSYASPSYYVQKMFGTMHGDGVLGATLDGGKRLFASVTRDGKTGAVFLHVVNAAATTQSVQITLTGLASVAATGTATVLTSAYAGDTNTLADPVKVVPRTSKATGLGKSFTYSFAPNSVNVLRLTTK